MHNVKPLSDQELIAAYEQISGEQGGPEVDPLLAEIERRGFHI